MAIERTLVLVKPDALQRELVGQVISRIERRGFKIVGVKMALLDQKTLKEHYAHLAAKPFFPRIAEFMSSAPVIAMAIEGFDAVEVLRKMSGVTKSSAAEPGTIRGDFALSVMCNIIHASDSKEAAAAELKRFFKASELFDWKRANVENVYAPDER
jgi:nucleoside-diphosphate kinase